MNFFLTNMLLLFSAFLGLTLAAPKASPAAVLQVRQSAPDPCITYSITANLSTIGSNTTYRSIFYSRSMTGTMYDNAMFKNAMLALPAMTKDVALNRQCGNLTDVAFNEAMRNFTQKIVGPFTEVAPEGIKAGPEVIVIVGGIMLMFSAVWSFMP